MLNSLRVFTLKLDIVVKNKINASLDIFFKFYSFLQGHTDNVLISLYIL